MCCSSHGNKHRISNVRILSGRKRIFTDKDFKQNKLESDWGGVLNLLFVDYSINIGYVLGYPRYWSMKAKTTFQLLQVSDMASFQWDTIFG